MIKNFKLNSVVLAAGMVVSAASYADALSTSDYQASKDRIGAEYKTADVACNQLAGNANEVCEQQAKGNQNIALAELEYRRSGTDADRAKIAMAKTEAAHELAEQKCNAKAGNAKDVCKKEADAVEVKANADAKLTKADAQARHEANDEARDADYKVAMQKCDALAGDAKAACATRAEAARSGDYQATKDRIVADDKAALMACDHLAGNAKDICQVQAKGDKNVAMAELEYRHTGTPADRANVAMTRSESVYEVAKERCDDKAGNAKDVCVKEADATHIKADADAKLAMTKAAARTEAAGEKREADYKVAIEKCDVLAGDSKAACVADSKLRFHKN